MIDNPNDDQFCAVYNKPSKFYNAEFTCKQNLLEAIFIQSPFNRVIKWHQSATVWVYHTHNQTQSVIKVQERSYSSYRELRDCQKANNIDSYNC